MKAKQRTILLLVALVIIAAAALALLTRANEKTEQAESAAAEGSIPLSSFDMDELSEMAITYNGETLTIQSTEEGWVLAEDTTYHLDETSCNTMRTALADLNALRELIAQSGEDYGMEEPQVTVRVTAAGQTNTFYFGAQNSITGDVYVQKEGSDAVYTVYASKLSCFALTKEELFGAFHPAGITSSDIEAITLTTAGGQTICLQAMSEPVAADEGADSTSQADSEAETAESNASSEVEYETVWRLADDTTLDLDAEKVDDLVSALSSYVTAQVTDGDSVAYGFDSPLATVQITTADGNHLMSYAMGTDGYYLMVDDDASIYTVNSTVIEALMVTEKDLAA